MPSRPRTGWERPWPTCAPPSRTPYGSGWRAETGVSTSSAGAGCCGRTSCPTASTRGTRATRCWPPPSEPRWPPPWTVDPEGSRPGRYRPAEAAGAGAVSADARRHPAVDRHPPVGEQPAAPPLLVVVHVTAPVVEPVGHQHLEVAASPGVGAVHQVDLVGEHAVTDVGGGVPPPRRV